MILIYPGEQKKNSSALLRVFEGAECAWLADYQKGWTMERILNDPCTRRAQSGGQGMPFVYFADEPVEKISAWQKRLEEEGLDVRAMAVATDENRGWTLRALMDEVAREAAYFQKRDALAEKLSRADRARFAGDEDYRRCFLLAADLLRQEELSERMLDTAIAVIESFDRERK